VENKIFEKENIRNSNQGKIKENTDGIKSEEGKMKSLEKSETTNSGSENENQCKLSTENKKKVSGSQLNEIKKNTENEIKIIEKENVKEKELAEKENEKETEKE
jgi:hypothetical protein